MSTRFMARYPWIVIVIGIIIVLNDWLKFAPEQVLRKPTNYIVPIICFVIGIVFYSMKKDKKTEKP